MRGIDEAVRIQLGYYIPEQAEKKRQELYQKEQEAIQQIENKTYRRSTPTVEEYCEKWLLMQSAQIRMTTLIDYTSKVKNYILAVERFWDDTRWMIEFSVLRPSTAYGSPGEEMRLFLTEDGYQAALQSQQRREIKIKRYARVIEGHILDFKPGKRRRS